MSIEAGNYSFTVSPAGVKPIPALRRSSGLSVQDFLVLFIPLSGFLELHVVGRLFAPDAIMLALFPFLVLKMGRHLADPMPRMFIIFGFIWLLGQAATDIIRHTVFQDLARGWAKIAFTLINFCVIYLLINSRIRRIILYALGLVGSGILGAYLNPNIYTAEYPWKFGIGGPITLLTILSAVWVTGRKKRHRFLSILLVGLIGLFNVYMGSRGRGGICLLTAVYLQLQVLWNRKRAKKLDLRPTKILVVFLISGLVAYLVINAYEYAVRQGMLGESALVKYEEVAYGKYGFLLGGRSETLVSFRAIIKSPVIGHGSWAKDWGYVDLLVELKRNLGYSPGGPSELGLIPSHSHFFGAWVEAGILGAIFWLWVTSLPVRMLTGLYQTRARLSPLVAFFALGLIWDILFSPYGAERRFVTPYYVTVMMVFLSPLLTVKSHRKMT